MYNPNNWVAYLEKGDRDLQNSARTDYFRGSGRGGQKKNKTSNAVRLVLGDIIVTETGSRSREANLQKATRKLRMGIAMDYKRAIKTRQKQILVPQKLMTYCAKGLIRINKKNSEYPLFLGFLVNIFLFKSCNYGETATFYKVSPSQLRKFISSDALLLENFRNIRQLNKNEYNISPQEHNGD